MYLQEAGGPREAQREGLGGDEEGLGVGLLGADGQGVHGPGADPGPRQAEQRVGAQRHGRVRHVVQVEHSQAQGGKTGHEGGLCRVGFRMDSSSSSSLNGDGFYGHKNSINTGKK